MSQERPDLGTVPTVRIMIPDEGADLLFGTHDSNLRILEDLFEVQIRTDGHHLLVDGSPSASKALERLV